MSALPRSRRRAPLPGNAVTQRTDCFAAVQPEPGTRPEGAGSTRGWRAVFLCFLGS